MATKRLYYRLEIVPVCGGWVVYAGCRQVVYMDTEEGRNKLKADFMDYLFDPDNVANRIMMQNISINHEGVAVAPPDRATAQEQVRTMPGRPERPLPYPQENEIRGAGASLLRTPEEMAARDANRDREYR